jgi:hypothetical protein
MKAWKMNVRLVTFVAVVCCCTAAKVQAQGPTVTVSPANLSFGVPGVTTGVSSAPESVTVSVGGTGTATVSINISSTMVNNEPIASQYDRGSRLLYDQRYVYTLTGRWSSGKCNTYHHGHRK